VSSVVTIANGTETSEIGFASNKPTTAVPSSLPAKQTVTVQVTSFLLCGNGPGDAPRFNDWTGRVTFTTPVGIFMIDVADHMRVNIP
jgi:actin-related protein